MHRSLICDRRNKQRKIGDGKTDGRAFRVEHRTPTRNQNINSCTRNEGKWWESLAWRALGSGRANDTGKGKLVSEVAAAFKIKRRNISKAAGVNWTKLKTLDRYKRISAEQRTRLSRDTGAWRVTTRTEPNNWIAETTSKMPRCCLNDSRSGG